MHYYYYKSYYKYFMGLINNLRVIQMKSFTKNVKLRSTYAWNIYLKLVLIKGCLLDNHRPDQVTIRELICC